MIFVVQRNCFFEFILIFTFIRSNRFTNINNLKNKLIFVNILFIFVINKIIYENYLYIMSTTNFLHKKIKN